MAKEIETIPELVNNDKTLRGEVASLGTGGAGRAEIIDIGKSRNRPRRFARTFTSLFIDDTSVKILMVKGKHVIKAAELPLEAGLVSDGEINAPKEVAQNLKSLLQDLKISGKRIIVGFSGLHCLSRVTTLPPLADRKLIDEAIQHEAASELPVPVEDLFLAWQIVQRSDKELKIFYIAYTRDIVDSLVETLEEAGIKRGLMDLAPLAITNVVNQKTAAIVDIRRSSIDIVVMVEGIPQLIRSLPLPKDKMMAEKLPVIREELERTIKFHLSDGNGDNGGNAKNGESAQGSFPVYISGELQDEPELYQSLVENLGYAVTLSLPPLVYPEPLVAARFMVNIGLILKKLKLNGQAGVSAINLNALPQVYRPKPVRLEQVSEVSGVLALAGLIVVGIILVRDVSNQTVSLRAEVASANQALVQKQDQLKTLTASTTNLEKEVAAANQALASLQGVQSGFGVQQSKVGGDLKLTESLLASNNLTLVSLQHNGDTVNLTGTAPSEAEVLSFTGDLTKSGRYAGIVISNLSRDQVSGGIAFTINLKVED
jgi:hypothetical protein